MRTCLADDATGECLCMLEEGHSGDHDFVPKSEIGVSFIGEPNRKFKSVRIQKWPNESNDGLD